jgi:hypothetical protein
VLYLFLRSLCLNNKVAVDPAKMNIKIVMRNENSGTEGLGDGDGAGDAVGVDVGLEVGFEVGLEVGAIVEVGGAVGVGVGGCVTATVTTLDVAALVVASLGQINLN